MTFTRLYAMGVSFLLIVEPFVLQSSFASAGTWFWWLLGVVGLVGIAAEHVVSRRKRSQSSLHVL